jgi:flagellin
MAMTINTNIASTSAQRHLNESRRDLDLAMERLSSGQRINSAKDDAAGLAIRDKMSSQIVGLNQSIRNANDAISLAQTAEGAMEESVSILQRMRVLAMQAVNDTNTDSDRANLNDEFTQLQLELTRIGITASFNNVKLLDGTFTGSTFQVGPGASETIFLKISDQKANAIGTTYDVASFDIFAANSPAKGDSVNLTIRGADGDGGNLTVNYTSAKAESAIQTASGMVLALNSNSTFTQSYQALSDANNSILIRRTDGTSMGLPVRAQFELTAAENGDSVTVTVGGVNTGGASKDFTYDVTTSKGTTAANIATGVADQLNADSTGFGRFYQAFADNGKVEIRAKDGTKVDTGKITVEQKLETGIDSYASTEVTLSVDTAIEAGQTAKITIDTQDFETGTLSAGVTASEIGDAFAGLNVSGWDISNNNGVVTFSKNADHSDGATVITGAPTVIIDPAGSSGTVNVAVNHSAAGVTAGAVAAGTTSKVINEFTGFEVTVAAASGLSVSGVVKAVPVYVDDTDVLSASAAMEAVRVVDDAVAMIGRERAGLGAFQNRLEHAMSNMANNSQNTQAARSVIADADYAKEAAALAKNQILQQAGTAMLAQANSQSETVLSLLK